MQDLLWEKGAIATVSINRPKALNALNRDLLRQLSELQAQVRADSAVRVLIITGVGERAFVAGADIAAMVEMSALEGVDFSRLGHAVMREFEELPIPVIAAVNGFALGGGLELALACDLIVASENARFGQPEINLGLIPGFGGTQRLAHRIGLNRARELIMTGEMFDARTAFTWGLVNKVVAPDRLMPEAQSIAEKLAGKSAVALRHAKAALRSAATMDEDGGLRFEQQVFGLTFASEDRIEGTSAFLEKRQPQWRHK